MPQCVACRLASASSSCKTVLSNSNRRPVCPREGDAALPTRHKPSPARPVARDLLGAHMPTAGGLHNALLQGRRIGCSVVQLFTGNPRQWEPAPLSEAQIAAFTEARAQTGIGLVVAHDSYLINLAAPDPSILARSRAAFRAELERAESLGIAWLVTHMGAHLGTGEDEGLGVLAHSVRRILQETAGCAVGIALETTAGQGTSLGYRFEHLARVIEAADGERRISVCFDTCHAFAAGYDLRDARSYADTWEEFDRVIGMDRLSVIHANDAKKPLGSRVDRHEHIGKGEIGLECFRLLVNDRRLAHIPVVIETPEAEKMHPVNLALLADLAAGSPREDAR